MSLLKVAIIFFLALLGLGLFSAYTVERMQKSYRQEHHCVKQTDIEAVVSVYRCDGGLTLYQ